MLDLLYKCYKALDNGNYPWLVPRTITLSLAYNTYRASPLYHIYYISFGLTMNELMHHDEPLGEIQPCRVSMMLECSTAELLARAAFMHH